METLVGKPTEAHFEWEQSRPITRSYTDNSTTLTSLQLTEIIHTQLLCYNNSYIPIWRQFLHSPPSRGFEDSGVSTKLEEDPDATKGGWAASSLPHQLLVTLLFWSCLLDLQELSIRYGRNELLSKRTSNNNNNKLQIRISTSNMIWSIRRQSLRRLTFHSKLEFQLILVQKLLFHSVPATGRSPLPYTTMRWHDQPLWGANNKPFDKLLDWSSFTTDNSWKC